MAAVRDFSFADSTGFSHRHVLGLLCTRQMPKWSIKNARDPLSPVRNEGVAAHLGRRSDHIAPASPEEKGSLYERPTTKVYRHPTFFDISRRKWGDVSTSQTDPNKGDLFEVCAGMGTNYPRSRAPRFGMVAGTPPWLEEDIALGEYRAWISSGKTNACGWISSGRGRRRGPAMPTRLCLHRERFGIPHLLLVEQPNGVSVQTLMRSVPV